MNGRPSTLPVLRRGPKKRRYEVRVVEDGEVLSEWVAAKRVDGDGFRIESHPVFGGAVLHRSELEVRKL
jgi:hypothetical protein